jgi:hypothetical protein
MRGRLEVGRAARVSGSRGEGAGRPSCRYCGDVIGIYEPVVLRLPSGTAHRTSRLAEPHLFTGDGEWYHELCFGFVDGAADEA